MKISAILFSFFFASACILAVSADPGEYNEQVDTPENGNQFEWMGNSNEQIPKESLDEIHMNDKDIAEVESDEENNDKAEFENDEDEGKELQADDENKRLVLRRCLTYRVGLGYCRRCGCRALMLARKCGYHIICHHICVRRKGRRFCIRRCARRYACAPTCKVTCFGTLRCFKRRG